MEIKLKAGDSLTMTVVGLHSTLDDIETGKGTVSLDFEGNEGDVWECEAEELERV